MTPHLIATWFPSDPYTAIVWVVVFGFAITFLVTIGAIIGLLPVMAPYRNRLFVVMIVELVSAGFYLFYAGVGSSETADITGLWSYHCKSQQATAPLEIGGYCEIRRADKKLTLLNIVIDGHRTWKKSAALIGTTPAPVTVPWTSYWAEVLPDNTMRFKYQLKPDGDTIDGLGEATFVSEGKEVKRMTGYFYQLPPHDALYGVMTFERIKNISEAKPPE